MVLQYPTPKALKKRGLDKELNLQEVKHDIYAVKILTSKLIKLSKVIIRQMKAYTYKNKHDIYAIKLLTSKHIKLSK